MYVETELSRRSDPPWESLVILPGNDVVSLTGLRTNTAYRLRWRSQGRVFSDVQVETMASFSYEVVHTSISSTITASTTSSSINTNFSSITPTSTTTTSITTPSTTSSSTTTSTTKGSRIQDIQLSSEIEDINNNSDSGDNSRRKVRHFNVTSSNGTSNQSEPRLLSQISQYNYTENSSLSTTKTDTRPRTKTTIPDNILVSTNSNNGLVYNVRNKLWYPATTQSPQDQKTSRQTTPSSQQPRSSKEQGISEIETISSRTSSTSSTSTYFPIRLTRTMGIESSRSYRRGEKSEKYSTPVEILSDRRVVVQSADIHVITQKTSAIHSVQNDIQSRYNLSS